MDLCLFFKNRAASLAHCSAVHPVFLYAVHRECPYGSVIVIRINFKILLRMWKYHPLLHPSSNRCVSCPFVLLGQIFQKLLLSFPEFPSKFCCIC